MPLPLLLQRRETGGADAGSSCTGRHDSRFLVLLDYSYTRRYRIEATNVIGQEIH